MPSRDSRQKPLLISFQEVVHHPRRKVQTGELNVACIERITRDAVQVFRMVAGDLSDMEQLVEYQGAA